MWEISLQAPDLPGLAEILSTVLLQSDIPPQSFTESRQPNHITFSVFLPTRQAGLRLASRLKYLKSSGIGIDLKPVKVEGWVAAFHDRLQPFQLTSRFDLVPYHQIQRYQPTPREAIIIDIDQAFGTGLHVTTRMMVELIERCCGRFNSFWDIGTGSGILSIVAAKCQARELTAIDIDPISIRSAQHNAKLNQVQFGLCRRWDLARWKGRRLFDFVAANLFTEDLIRMGRKIVTRVRPDFYLAVSGIAEENWPRFQRAYKKFPLRVQVSLKRAGWRAVLYKKSGL